MTPYEFGRRAAMQKIAVYPEEYEASGMLGALGGGAAGAVGGGYLGHQLAQHLGQSTRTLGLPGTGVGENMFTHNTGPLVGELLGGLGGAAVGGAMGHHGGHLSALRKSPPPRRLVQDQAQDSSALMRYLLEQSQGQGQQGPV